MATTMYVDEAQVREHLAKQNINHDAQLTRVIGAACNYVDWWCGRGFRRYTGQARETSVQMDGIAYIIDLIPPATTVMADTDYDMTFTTEIDSASYILHPRIEHDGSPAARHQKLSPLSTGDNAYLLVPGIRLQITGDWGYVEGDDDHAPDAVQYAVMLFVARWYKRREAPLQVATMPGYGFRRLMAEDADAKDILKEYRHERRMVFIK